VSTGGWTRRREGMERLTAWCHSHWQCGETTPFGISNAMTRTATPQITRLVLGAANMWTTWLLVHGWVTGLCKAGGLGSVLFRNRTG
jgi:hypothetical protein